ncbi:MAG TPA: ATP-binding cassette domain-containing protein [Verrucomicrobiae bacterium]|jgi:peptide/nickel transport system ATP-binding protein|nr:ATP-binding cassette domain-containing protein [Verrucomicrobiae bacterium]
MAAFPVNADYTESYREPLLRVQGLNKRYARSGFWSKTKPVQALSDVSLEIQSGSTTAIVGESGSGKTTLAMCMAQLETPDSGDIWLKSQRLTGLAAADLLPIRQKVQLIFQSSASALNPRLSAIEIVAEPLDILGMVRRERRRELALEYMQLTGLTADLAGHSPLTLSGGQRQRLAIARALTLKPELLIFDESFSGLDLILEAQILELLRTLKTSCGFTYLVITHDLSLVAGLADYVAVMQSGKIVEQGLASRVFLHAQHPHTLALLAAMPRWTIGSNAGSGA